VAAEVLSRLLPGTGNPVAETNLAAVLEKGGFDPVAHEAIRASLRSGTIGLAQNRLPPATTIEDARDGDVVVRRTLGDGFRATGLRALQEGRVMVLTLAGGAGTRWTQGAGTVKALHPFARLGGRYRNRRILHRVQMVAPGRLDRPGVVVNL